MITVYSTQNNFSSQIITEKNVEALENAVWIDVVDPSGMEADLVNQVLGFEIPTRHEMQEIEFSSRLYKESSSLFMTVSMVAKSESAQPISDAVTLILTDSRLITIRFIEPQSFALFISRLAKSAYDEVTPTNLLIELLDASVDRLADVLEGISHRLEEYSQIIFRSQEHKPEKTDFKNQLQGIGASGDLGTKVQESLITFNRLITFFEQNITTSLTANTKSKITTLTKDIYSLSDYVNFLSHKVSFLLDATLGMVNIEQNNIIKIFSIAAVILLPPTLVASIYGMNFVHMPELSWRFGYPFAIGLMLFSAWVPYKYFKRKKWF